MNLRIVNETPYKKIRIVCDDKIVLLKKNESTTLCLDSQNARIQIDILDKNRTLFFIFALLDLWCWEFLTTDSASFTLHCSTTFNIVFNELYETLVLNNFNYLDKNTFCEFNSVYVKNENSTITNTTYFDENSKKVRNKTIRNLLLFVSGLPFIVLFLWLGIKETDFSCLIAAFLIFCFFTIPSILKSIKIWKYCKNEYINMFLSQQEAILRQNNDEEPKKEPTGFIAKAIYKLFR